MKTWDSNLPSGIVNQVALLVERRNSLQEGDREVQNKQLIAKHKNSVLRQYSIQQNNVETMIENEKAHLIQFFDDEICPPRRYSAKRFPTLEQSTISFQDQSMIQHKSSKTNQSASTNVSAFNSHSPLPGRIIQTQENESDHTIKQLQAMLLQQQMINKENQSEISNLKQSKSELESQIQLQEKQYTKLQKQTELFKENLVNKLTSYAHKLEQLNSNEEKLIIIQQENAKLKMEKEELLILLKRK